MYARSFSLILLQKLMIVAADPMITDKRFGYWTLTRNIKIIDSVSCVKQVEENMLPGDDKNDDMYYRRSKAKLFELFI